MMILIASDRKRKYNLGTIIHFKSGQVDHRWKGQQGVVFKQGGFNKEPKSKQKQKMNIAFSNRLKPEIFEVRLVQDMPND